MGLCWCAVRSGVGGARWKSARGGSKQKQRAAPTATHLVCGEVESAARERRARRAGLCRCVSSARGARGGATPRARLAGLAPDPRALRVCCACAGAESLSRGSSRRGGGHPAGRAGAAHPGVKGLAKGSWCKGKRGKEQARCAGPPGAGGACVSAVAARRRVRARVGRQARSRRGDRKTSQCFWRWLRARVLRGARARAAVLSDGGARACAARGAARIRRETWLILPVLYAHLKD